MTVQFDLFLNFKLKTKMENCFAIGTHHFGQAPPDTSPGLTADCALMPQPLMIALIVDGWMVDTFHSHRNSQAKQRSICMPDHVQIRSSRQTVRANR